jgi:hypothetical protein
LQDYITGYWTVMSKAEAVEETRRALIMQNKPLVKVLASYWKQVLADARFGLLRDTVMARTWIPKTVTSWLDGIIFVTSNSAEGSSPLKQCHAKDQPAVASSSPASPSSSSSFSNTVVSMTKQQKVPASVSFKKQLAEMSKSVLTLYNGDIVLVKKGQYSPYPAKIIKILNSEQLRVHSLDDVQFRPVVSIDDIEPLRPIQKGDNVLIPPADDDEDDWTSSEVLMVDPFGYVTCMVGGRDDENAVIETLDINEMFPDRSQLPPHRLALV